MLQADGGTRTASITGGCVALFQALQNHHDDHRAIKSYVAAKHAEERGMQVFPISKAAWNIVETNFK